jgi:hypothetical protein
MGEGKKEANWQTKKNFPPKAGDIGEQSWKQKVGIFGVPRYARPDAIRRYRVPATRKLSSG